MVEGLEEYARGLASVARMLQLADSAEVGHEVAQCAAMVHRQLADELAQRHCALLVRQAYY